MSDIDIIGSRWQTTQRGCPVLYHGINFGLRLSGLACNILTGWREGHRPVVEMQYAHFNCLLSCRGVRDFTGILRASYVELEGMVRVPVNVLSLLCAPLG